MVKTKEMELLVNFMMKESMSLVYRLLLMVLLFFYLFIVTILHTKFIFLELLITYIVGGILTVADDFLTDSGKKFLYLMEALSKRKEIRVGNNSGVRTPYVPIAEEGVALAGLSDNEWDDEASVSDDYEEDDEVKYF